MSSTDPSCLIASFYYFHIGLREVYYSVECANGDVARVLNNSVNVVPNGGLHPVVKYFVRCGAK